MGVSVNITHISPSLTLFNYQQRETLVPLTFYSVMSEGSMLPFAYFQYYNVWVLLPHGNLNHSVFIDAIYKHKVITTK